MSWSKSTIDENIGDSTQRSNMIHMQQVINDLVDQVADLKASVEEEIYEKPDPPDPPEDLTQFGMLFKEWTILSMTILAGDFSKIVDHGLSERPDAIWIVFSETPRGQYAESPPSNTTRVMVKMDSTSWLDQSFRVFCGVLK